MIGKKQQFRTEDNMRMFSAFPSFLWFSDKINAVVVRLAPGLSAFHEVDNSMHCVVLFAAILSFLMATGSFKFLINPICFALLWLCYNSIFCVGGIFMSFQWDTFLLEAGFLTIFFAPLTSNSKAGIIAKIVRELIRWLMFRLMFGSGVTKLLSDCPTWWGLTALNYHFESQPLANGISWYAHHLPDPIKKLGVIDTFIVQLLLPLLFFSPLRFHRIFAGIRQNMLMLMIMITGNYNFFNLLTMVVNLVNFDDEFILFVTPKWLLKVLNFDIPEIKNKNKQTNILKIISSITPISMLVGITVYFYSIFDFGRVTEPRPLHRLFTLKDMKYLLEETNYVMYFIIYVAVFVFCIHCTECLKILNKIIDIKSFAIASFKILLYTGFIVIVGVFFVGTVGVFNLNKQLSKYGKSQTALLSTFHIVNSYGLFRRMTGVEGRDELIFYGSDDGHKWKLYEFYHKPSKTNIMPTFIAPHQPRLDWQLWFSALQPRVNPNDYVIMLVQKMLYNSPSVMQLLKTNPFDSRPPKFIKINKYTYHFSDWNELKSDDWIPKIWWNSKVSVNSNFLQPIHLKDQLNNSPDISEYPLHHMQQINLLYCYIGFYISLITIYGVKLILSLKSKSKVQNQEDKNNNQSTKRETIKIT